MAQSLPPIPNNPITDTFVWRDWFFKVSQLLVQQASIAWTSLDFTGSNLLDIQTRQHNALQAVQGGLSGQYYHLTSAQYTTVATLPTFGTMATQNANAVNITGGTITGVPGLGMTYPGAGIANSTGSAWGTSYGTTGTGSVVLNDSPTITTALTVTGQLNLTGAASGTQNIATGQSSGSLNIGATNGTAAINLGRSTDNQTINIGTGAVASTKTKTIKIGTGDGGGSVDIQLGNDSSNYCLVEIKGTLSQTVADLTTIGNYIPTAGARAFISDHYSTAIYPLFGEIYSPSGVNGPFTVPLYHDGSDWRVG